MTDSISAWRAGIEAAQAEAGGVMRLYIVAPTDFPGLLGAAICGDPEAERLVRAVSDTVGRIERAPKRTPILCGSCPAALKSPRFCVGVAMPERDTPSQGVGFALCDACVNGAVSVPDLALATLRRIWPDGRLVTMTDTVGGRA